MESSEPIEILAKRVAALEAFLARQGFSPTDVPRIELSPAPAAPRPSASPLAMPPPLPPPLPKRVWPPDAPAAVARAPLTPIPVATPVARPISYGTPPPRATASTPSSSMEQAIGLKVAGWIGAIILVIGAAMGVKFAYDQGWLGNLPPEFKLGLMYTAALAIIAAGEFVYRKVDTRAAVGIYAAGIASLFVVGYAGSAYLNLYGLQTAFGLMAGASLIGALISLRGGFVSIAVLSHIGANVAPLILHDRVVGPMPLFGYLLALQVMAVSLAFIGKGRRWWVLRTLALISTSLWMSVRLIDGVLAHASLTILFACIYAAVFQLELILSALRADTQARRDPTLLNREPTFSLATFSLAVTGTFTVALLRWSDQFESSHQRGLYLVALAAFAGIAGVAFIRSNGRAMKSLATSWLTQAGLLLVIAVPVLLNGPAITIGWSALAVAYAVLGVAVKRSRTVFAGAGVWIVAALQLVVAVATEGYHDRLHSPFTRLNGVDVPTYLAIAIVLGAAGHLVALLAASARLRSAQAERHRPLTAFTSVPDSRDATRRWASNVSDATQEPATRGVAATGVNAELNDLDTRLDDVMAIAASTAWIIAIIGALPALGATIGLLAVAWTLVIIGLLAKRAIYAGGGLAVVVLAMAKWAAIDVLGERLGVDAPTRHILFNAPMAVGAACAASLLIMLWRGATGVTDEKSAQWKWAALLAVIVSMTIGLSVEVERAAWANAGRSPWPTMQLVMFGWTILWIAAAHVPAIVGRTFDSSRGRLTLARDAASLVLLLLAAKFIALDSIAFSIDRERVRTLPGVNVQTMIALGITAALALSARRKNCPRPLAAALRAGIFAVPLVIGSIELDRVLGPSRTLMAWSVFWGVYAIASIVLGFARRAASFRFAGLGLLGITLLKIVFVDLASAGTGWRILSFLAVGIVLLLTSVVYGKLSPKLLSSAHPAPPHGIPREGENLKSEI